ncbi:MAG TPA: arsenate reductase ArsC [Thermohalobaculum sp.]|nr:arsenate reductase ArsC [Thermohalobaculum sp.]
MAHETQKAWNILFLCTGNSARSIMAEAICRKGWPRRLSAYSAGSHPKAEVNERALSLLRHLGHDTEGLRSKSWDEFAAADAPRMDFVITVCDDAAGEVCPAWPGQPMTAHWGMPDPAQATGTEAEIALAFDQAYGMLDRRIGILANLPIATLDSLRLKRALDDIGNGASQETMETAPTEHG